MILHYCCLRVVCASFLLEKESFLFVNGEYVLNITFVTGSIFGLIRIPRWRSLFSKEVTLDLNVLLLVF